ncbi:MAG: hypothetical protein FD136_1104, partial [Chitinophagaceae bacterium]
EGELIRKIIARSEQSFSLSAPLETGSANPSEARVS